MNLTRGYCVISILLVIAISGLMKTTMVINTPLERILKLIVLSGYLSYITIYLHRQRRLITLVSIDTILAAGFTLLSILFITAFHGVSVKNAGIPLEFGLTYFGLFCLIHSGILTRNDYKIIFSALLLTAFIHVVFGYALADYSILSGKADFKTYFSKVWKGLYPLSVDYALASVVFTALSAAALLYFLSMSRIGWAFVTLFMFSLGLFSTIMSGARSSLLGFALFFSFSFYTFAKTHKKELLQTKAILLLITLVFLCGFIILQTGSVAMLIEKTAAKGSSRRFLFWKAFVSQPFRDGIFAFLFGRGYEVYSVIPLPSRLQDLHNFLLTICARNGFINMLIILVLIVRTQLRNIGLQNIWFIAPIGLLPLTVGLFDDKIVLSTTSILPLLFMFTFFLHQIDMVFADSVSGADKRE